MLEMHDVISAKFMQDMARLIQGVRLLTSVNPYPTQRFLDTQENPWFVLVQLNFNHTVNNAGLIVDS
ncbi:hypothetical protein HYP05_gp047 [Salmonella phage ST-W77]|uniref:Uncharacterized protein n=2 Tax=Kuttervirus TaxID=2169536 RepID=A0A678QID9_9CAUD|nr:hypothetical protein HYP05_gp047 [Salmonella phage ST-W77]YP_009879543.1 hypothetical protein HYP54_gp130 [Escherichia phage FEC14]ARB12201.1 hypothetical protein STW77_0047 [Salmonella phage ST-W77]ATW66803.1 hypothetical protein [Escherichia phage FEC14]